MPDRSIAEADGNWKNSIIACSKAFREASLDYQQKKSKSQHVPFMSLFDVSDAGKISGSLGRVLKALIKRIEYLDEQVDAMALGVDLRRYARFKEKSPYVLRLHQRQGPRRFSNP